MTFYFQNYNFHVLTVKTMKTSMILVVFVGSTENIYKINLKYRQELVERGKGTLHTFFVIQKKNTWYKKDDVNLCRGKTFRKKRTPRCLYLFLLLIPFSNQILHIGIRYSPLVFGSKVWIKNQTCGRSQTRPL